MSWKDYFHFSKGQQRGLLSLIVILLVIFGIDAFFYYKKTPQILLKDKNFLAEVETFTASLQNRRKTPYVQSFQKNFEYPYPQKENRKQVVAELFPFDPNALDSAGFVRLGLKSFMARNILKYRKNGGKFRTADDFAKVYSLSPEQFAELKPYIQIKEEEKPAVQEEIAAFIAELNTADTTDLQQVRGIYPGTARQIISYRKRLGGYISHEQLLEIRNFTPEKLERLKPFLTVDNSQIRKIELNRASIDFMRNHPYINFYQAKAIYEYRRNKGKIKSIEELRSIKDDNLTDAFWEKIMPYIAL